MYKYNIKILIFAGPGKRFVIREYLKSYTTKLSLTIKNVRDTDFGTYRCLAKNSLGDSDGSIKLSGTATTQNKTSLIIILLGDLKGVSTHAFNTIHVPFTIWDNIFCNLNHWCKNNFSCHSFSDVVFFFKLISSHAQNAMHLL